MSERVAIVGRGQTAGKRRRPEINEVELVNEAVRAALADAQLSIRDIDAVVMGNMEFFEGTFFTDQWLGAGGGSPPPPRACSIPSSASASKNRTKAPTAASA